jgi:hypothetical protein
MRTLIPKEDSRAALLRGMATIFDLSGTGVHADVETASPDSDMEALRMDYRAIGGDFWKVLRRELEGQR